jgi:predicted GIY-YIG superfamily endonuclease
MRIKIKPAKGLFGAGIYGIYFSNGKLYIGASASMAFRISNHCRAIRSNFSITDTCKALKPMKDFEGEVEFQLLHQMEWHESRWIRKKMLHEAEMRFIKQHIGNPNLLNIVSK